MSKMVKTLIVLMILAFVASLFVSVFEAEAEEIGSLVVAKKILSGNDKLHISAVDDPENPWITCYVTTIASGKIFKLADPSNASISCRQMKEMPKSINTKINKSIFSRKKSVLSKVQKIARFYDKKRHAFTYVVYTTKAIGGSFKNSISVVPLGR